MGQSVVPATRSHYRRMQGLQVLALGAAGAAWANVDQDFITESWSEASREFEPILAETQRLAAVAGASYGAETLVQTSGEWRAPEAFVNPRAFAGVASSGAPLGALLAAPAYRSLHQIGQGLSVPDALQSGRYLLQGIVRTQVADAGRLAAGVDAASRAGVGYVRMLNPPSCSRCVVLAGRRYRYNQGFRRHPQCDCVHELATTKRLSAAESEGLLVDQYEYFDSLSEAEQNRIFTNSGAEAIRAGADMNRVVNSRRGMEIAGRRRDPTTVELTGTRRNAQRYPDGRLSPEGIYDQASSREEAVRLLEQNGYLYQGGQSPGGGLRGWDYEGFRPATQTAAQRRLETSRLRYEAAQEGRNPYGKGPATPAQQARAEKEYRAWLMSDGEIFTE